MKTTTLHIITVSTAILCAVGIVIVFTSGMPHEFVSSGLGGDRPNNPDELDKFKQDTVTVLVDSYNPES